MVSLGLPHPQLGRKMIDLTAADKGRANVPTRRELMQLRERLDRGDAIGAPLRGGARRVHACYEERYLTRGLPENLMVGGEVSPLGSVPSDSRIVFRNQRPYPLFVMATVLGSEPFDSLASTNR